MKIYLAKMKLKLVDWDNYYLEFTYEPLEDNFEEKDLYYANTNLFGYPSMVSKNITKSDQLISTSVVQGFDRKLSIEELVQVEERMKNYLKAMIIDSKDAIIKEYDRKLKAFEGDD